MATATLGDRDPAWSEGAAAPDPVGFGASLAEPGGRWRAAPLAGVELGPRYGLRSNGPVLALFEDGRSLAEWNRDDPKVLSHVRALLNLNQP